MVNKNLLTEKLFETVSDVLDSAWVEVEDAVNTVFSKAQDFVSDVERNVQARLADDVAPAKSGVSNDPDVEQMREDIIADRIARDYDEQRTRDLWTRAGDNVVKDFWSSLPDARRSKRTF